MAPLLRMENIFGVDLYAAGLAEQVLGYLNELTAGSNAVKETLERYLR